MPGSTSSSPVLGTMIVIVLRAKNLPNRVKIGKQNPYTTLTYGIHKKRTETVERGGQQPTWDAEFRFEILKDSAEQAGAISGATVNKLGGVASAAGTVSDDGKKLPAFTSTPSVTGTSVVNADTRGKKVLKLACWADDPKDPKLVGEGFLELEETIKRGAFDDWVKLERKGRYAGEIYLELTWYPTDPPPQKQRRQQPAQGSSTAGSSYGGPGARTEYLSDDEGTTQHEQWENRKETGSTVSYGRPTSRLGDYPDPDLAPLSQSMSDLNVSQSRPPLPAPPSTPSQSIYAQSHAHRLSQSYSRPDLSASYSQPPPASHELPPNYRRASYNSYGSVAHPPSVPPQQPTPAQHVHQGVPQLGEFGGHQQQSVQFSHPLPTIGRDATYYSGAARPPMGQFEQLAHQHYENQNHYHSHQAIPPPPSLQHHDPSHVLYGAPPRPPHHDTPAVVSHHSSLPALPSETPQQYWASQGVPPPPPPATNALPPPPTRPHSTSSVHPVQQQMTYSQPPPPPMGYDNPAHPHYPQQQHQPQYPSSEYSHSIQSTSPAPPAPAAAPTPSYSPAPPLNHSHSTGNLHPTPYYAFAPAPTPQHPLFAPLPPPPRPPQPPANYYVDQNQSYSNISPPPTLQQAYPTPPAPPAQQQEYYSHPQDYPHQAYVSSNATYIGASGALPNPAARPRPLSMTQAPPPTPGVLYSSYYGQQQHPEPQPQPQQW